LNAFRGKSILVTGAGGSIGSALSLRLAALHAGSLLLLDASEQSLYRLQLSLADAADRGNTRLVLGNVADNALLSEAFDRCSPQIVFHAAAYKHVPLLEDHPLEAIANNTLNTLALAELCQERGVARFVLVSTDKAVAPISILGASKRIAERIALAMGGVVLRLGNVLGSEGSVSEIFERQIADGGPITITDPEAQRYFLTCEEAVDLLLLAAVEARPGALLVPAIDRQQSIASIAEFLVASQARGRTIAVQRIQSRPGDKLREALWSTSEKPESRNNHGFLELGQSSAQPLEGQLPIRLCELRAAVGARNLNLAMKITRDLVPDYSPSQTALERIQQTVSGARPR
jgi:FlaA1/EpsC-like NDP-sugar epimerase